MMRRGILVALVGLLLLPAGVAWAQDDMEGDDNSMAMPGVGGDLRIRTIYKSPFDYFTTDGGDPTGDDGTLMRTRVHFDWELANNVAVFLQIQDSRLWGVDSVFPGADPDLDVKQAYASLNNLQEVSFLEWIGDNDVDMHVGRIKLPNFGDGYIISDNEWFNDGPTAWDGFWFDTEIGGEDLAFDVDLLWADLLNGDPNFSTPFAINIPGAVGTGATGPAEGAIFWGIQAGTDDIDFVGGEVYYWYYAGDGILLGGADEDLSIYGIRLFSNFAEDSGLEDLDVVFEYAMQDGESGTQDIDADFWMIRASYALPVEDLNPMIGLGISTASGDSDPATGDFENWISPLQEVHNHLGHYDLFFNSNIQDIFLTSQVTLMDSVDVHLDFHLLTLDEEGSGVPSVFAGGGAGAATTDDDLGTEIDLYATWDCGESLMFEAGWSYFMVGDAMEDAAGNFDDNGHFLYLQMTVPFGKAAPSY